MQPLDFNFHADFLKYYNSEYETNRKFIESLKMQLQVCEMCRL